MDTVQLIICIGLVVAGCILSKIAVEIEEGFLAFIGIIICIIAIVMCNVKSVESPHCPNCEQQVLVEYCSDCGTQMIKFEGVSGND